MQGVEQICQGRKMVHIFWKQFRHFLLSNVSYQLILLLCSSQSQLHVFSISPHSASLWAVPQPLAVMLHSFNKTQSLSPYMCRLPAWQNYTVTCTCVYSMLQMFVNRTAHPLKLRHIHAKPWVKNNNFFLSFTFFVHFLCSIVRQEPCSPP